MVRASSNVRPGSLVASIFSLLSSPSHGSLSITTSPTNVIRSTSADYIAPIHITEPASVHTTTAVSHPRHYTQFSERYSSNYRLILTIE